MVAFVKTHGPDSQEVLAARGGVREIRDILQDVLAQYDLRDGSRPAGYLLGHGEHPRVRSARVEELASV